MSGTPAKPPGSRRTGQKRRRWWRRLDRTMTAAIGAATVAGAVYLGSTGPLTSPVQPAPLAAAAAPAAPLSSASPGTGTSTGGTANTAPTGGQTWQTDQGGQDRLVDDDHSGRRHGGPKGGHR